MKVLLVANGFPPYAVGGVEVYTAGMAQALHARGHAVSVLCVESNPREPDYRLIEEQAGPVALFRLINNYNRIHSFTETFANPCIDEIFGGLLDRLQPDLVHFNHLIALSAGMPPVVASRGIPSLFTAHDFWALCQRIYLQDWLKQACPGPACGGQCYTCITAPTPVNQARTLTISALRNVIPLRLRVLLRRLFVKDDYFLPNLAPTPAALDARYELFRSALEATGRIVTPSEFVKQVFVNNGYRAEHINVLPLGMSETLTGPDRDASTGARAGQPLRFGFVGAVLPLKGADVLVRAFMAAPGANMRLILQGREDIVPAFARALRQEAARDRRIVFGGPFQPADKDRAYEAFDVLVIPSMAMESFSLVAREALLRGKPVIAANIGALPEVVQDGINGFLVPPGDVGALTELLVRLASHPEQLARLQLPGPVTILSVDQHVDRLLEIYESCRASRS